MKPAEKIEYELLHNLITNIEKSESYLTNLSALLGDIFDSPLADVISDITEDYIQAVEVVTGIDREHICWFIWDNDKGSAGLEFNGVKITTLAEFFKEVKK